MLSVLVRNLLTVMLVVSSLIHCGLLCLAAWCGLSLDSAPMLIPPQPGRFSVALEASQSETPPETPVERPFDVMPRPEPVEQELPRLLTALPELPLPEVAPEPVPEPPPTKPPEKPKVVQPKAEKKPVVVKPKASPSSRPSEGADIDEAPDYYYNPTPIYPADALARKLEGYVIVLARIDVRGQVDSVKLAQSSGLDSFDESALSAVRRWVFYPARRRGAAVAVTVEVPVRFEIRARSGR